MYDQRIGRFFAVDPLEHKFDNGTLTVNPTFEVSGIEPNMSDGLQLIQTVETSDQQYGDKGKFVDGGNNSPFVTHQKNPPAHATMPYYMTSSENSRLSTFNSTIGNGTVTAYDVPTAANHVKKVSFETIIVATNYNNSGKPLPIASFSWGWKNKGTTPLHSGINLKTGKSVVSDNANRIINHDYSSFQFYKPTYNYDENTLYHD